MLTMPVSMRCPWDITLKVCSFHCWASLSRDWLLTASAMTRRKMAMTHAKAAARRRASGQLDKFMMIIGTDCVAGKTAQGRGDHGVKPRLRLGQSSPGRDLQSTRASGCRVAASGPALCFSM